MKDAHQNNKQSSFELNPCMPDAGCIVHHGERSLSMPMLFRKILDEAEVVDPARLIAQHRRGLVFPTRRGHGGHALVALHMAGFQRRRGWDTGELEPSMFDTSLDPGTFETEAGF